MILTIVWFQIFAHEFRWQKCDLPALFTSRCKTFRIVKFFDFILLVCTFSALSFYVKQIYFPCSMWKIGCATGTAHTQHWFNKPYLCARTTQTQTRSRFLAIPFILFRSSFFTILRILACEWKNISQFIDEKWNLGNSNFTHTTKRSVRVCVHFTYELHVCYAIEWRVKEKWDVSFWAISFRFSAVYVYFRCRYPDETDPRQEKCVRATSWKFNYHQIVLGCWCAYFKYSFTEWSSLFHRFSFAGRNFSHRVAGACMAYGHVCESVNVRKKITNGKDHL